jgi:hypothetical protein
LRVSPSWPVCRPGDTGTVKAVLQPLSPAGRAVYQRRVDAGKATLYPTFYADELERQP